MTEGSKPIRLGLVGVGKIARDQHLPAIAADTRFKLVATASPHDAVEGVPAHRDIFELLAAGHDLDAVTLCTPPAGRREIAAAALDAGLHVMLEKPPAATLSEVADLIERKRDKTLFASWHSREAPGVQPAREWLADKQVQAVRITWKEDIRRWHPGQEWILGPGGFGVFDPAINALSIVTAILPDSLWLEHASMHVPEGRASPIAAALAMRSGAAPVTADLDFLQTGPQSWDIDIETDAGPLKLSLGGSVLQIGSAEPQQAPDREYPRLYAHFADLIARGESDVDIAPLRLIADAFMLGARRTVETFAF